VAFSPDSNRLVTVAEDRTVKLWSVDSDRELATFHGHTHFVLAVAFNADGYLIASGGFEGQLKVWFASPRLQLTYHNHSGWVRAVAIHPDGRRVASAASRTFDDTRTVLWDIATGEPDLFLPTGHLHNLAFSFNGMRLAIGETKKPAELWDLHTRTPLFFLPEQHGVWALAISPNGRRLTAGGGSDDSVRIWDVETGKVLHRFPEVGRDISNLTFSPDGHLVAVASTGAYGFLGTAEPAIVRVWDVDSGSEVRRLDGPFLGAIGGLAFLPDGRRLVSVGGKDLGGPSVPAHK
jgi:WD40 repeat protein